MSIREEVSEQKRYSQSFDIKTFIECVTNATSQNEISVETIGYPRHTKNLFHFEPHFNYKFSGNERKSTQITNLNTKRVEQFNKISLKQMDLEKGI